MNDDDELSMIEKAMMAIALMRFLAPGFGGDSRGASRGERQMPHDDECPAMKMSKATTAPPRTNTGCSVPVRTNTLE